MIRNLESAEELNGIVKSAGNLLLYFYNDDCAPCLSLRPKVEDLVREKFPLMEMLYIDGKSFPHLVGEYHAFGFPVLIIFFDGKEYLRYSKYVSLMELEESIGRIYKLYHQ
jgi:thioredoxin 1